MSTATTIEAPSLAEMESMPLVDIGRYIARLDREHDAVCDKERDAGGDSPGSLSDEMGDALYHMSDEVLGRTPKTIADAAVLLLAISMEFRDPLGDLGYRAVLMDGWNAMGRLIKFLAEAAKFDPADIGSRYWTNSVDGLDTRLAVEWWAQRFLENGGTFILSEKGGVGYYSPREDAEQAERFRSLFEEHASLDGEIIAQHVGELTWKGLDCDGLPQQVIPGKRWAVAWQPNRTDETCIITTQIVTDRPWPTKGARA